MAEQTSRIRLIEDRNIPIQCLFTENSRKEIVKYGPIPSFTPNTKDLCLQRKRFCNVSRAFGLKQFNYILSALFGNLLKTRLCGALGIST